MTLLALLLQLVLSAAANDCGNPLASPPGRDPRFSKLISDIQTKGKAIGDNGVIEIIHFSGDISTGERREWASLWGSRIGLVSEKWTEQGDGLRGQEQYVVMLNREGRVIQPYWKIQRVYEGSIMKAERTLPFTSADAEAKADETLRFWFCAEPQEPQPQQPRSRI